jgi:hypothetical protein
VGQGGKPLKWDKKVVNCPCLRNFEQRNSKQTLSNPENAGFFQPGKIMGL